MNRSEKKRLKEEEREQRLRERDIARLRRKKNTILSNEEIITMDWLFANIVGEIPEKYELKEQAKPIVELQGVKGEKE